jgi:hypothetical protein
MNLPLFPNEAFGHELNLVLGTLIGFGFGFVLERGGFGRAPILAAQFYGSDNRVLKVMFSGIVTALLGVTLLSAFGVLDLKLLFIPETFLWPQLVGGLLLGVGFIVSGYCPGTSIVSAASGNLDGLVTVVGVIGGSLLFGAFYPVFVDFYQTGAMGVIRLPDLLGVPDAVVAAGVVVMAVAAFLGVEKLERALAKKRGTPVPDDAPRTRNRVLAGFGLTSAAVVATLLLPVARAPEAPPKAFASISPLTLARALVEQPTAQQIVDLRDRVSCEKKRIPGASCLPADDPEGKFFASLPETRKLVLYAEGPLRALPEPAQRFPGQVVVLEGGFEAFRETVLAPPAVPRAPTPEAIAEFKLRSALHGYFTGARVQQAAPAIPVHTAPGGAKKKAGGC